MIVITVTLNAMDKHANDVNHMQIIRDHAPPNEKENSRNTDPSATRTNAPHLGESTVGRVQRASERKTETVERKNPKDKEVECIVVVAGCCC